MVDGVRLPVRLAGHPALDFCNTWAGWGEPPEPGRDWLRDYATLAVWTQYTELTSPEVAHGLQVRAHRDPRTARGVLADARRLRTVLHAAVLDPQDGRALSGVAGFVRRAYEAARLCPGSVPTWRVPESAGLELPLLVTALAAAELLTSPDVASVRVCPGHECGWLFIDRSGRRRWCSMSSCGNRAKVRAYAERHRDHRPTGRHGDG